MLLTKLHIPPVGINIVHRSGLFEKLNTGLNKKLILISAPAGFGKTTIICDWINQNKFPTAWYSLDKGDNDPVEFLSYIISSIRNVHKDFGLKAFELLKSPNKPGNLSIAVLLINEIVNIRQNFLLVLDDFHLIDNNEIIELVAYLVEYIPDNIHLAILTRSDPNLPVGKLRSKNYLLELRASDLSFSINDISILFNKKMKIGLSTEDIEKLATKTEGWIAGLQLSALSMQGRQDVSGFIKELKGDNRYIMDYLLEEVLKIQPEEIKEFLLKTSILEQISAPLCNAILNREESQSLIEHLEKTNMFIIPLDDERNWYRYHHLFAELLKQRLYQSNKESINTLHIRAYEWFEKNNIIDLAIEHASAIDNYDKCVQLIKEVVEEMWINGQHTTILKYGNLIPDVLLKSNPEICLYYAWILISNGQQQKAKPYLISAEKEILHKINEESSSNDEVKYNKNLLSKICVAFANMYSIEDNPNDILDSCQKALQNLSIDDHLWHTWVWYFSGLAYYSLGSLNESTKAFQHAFEYGKKSGNILALSTIVVRIADVEQQLGHYKAAYDKCIDLLSLIKEKGFDNWAKNEWSFAGLYATIGITHLMWAELDKAYENIKTAFNLCKNSSDINLKSFVIMSYLGVLYMRSDKIEAEIREKEFENLINNNQVSPFLVSYYISWKAFRLFELNQFEQAYKFFNENGITLEGKKTPINDSAYSMLVRLLIKQSKITEAEQLLSELFDLAESGKRIERIIDIKMIYSNLNRIKGNSEKALENMIEAMELAADENLIMYVMYNIDSNIDLIKDTFKLQAAGKTRIPKEFIEKFKLALDRQEKFKKAGQDSELSVRELETLKLIAENLSNQEIADKLFISLNTVKTHLKNIYLKLEVDSRTKAVAKGKEIQII